MASRHSQAQDDWYVFPTALGYCGIAWREKSVTTFLLQEEKPDRLRRELQAKTGNRLPAKSAPAWLRAVIQRVQKHLQGKPQDFSGVPVALEQVTPFMRAVYQATRQVPAGTLVSYADLAERIGNPGAVRAVGTALGKNPVALIVPCHRIIAASGKLGGFSAHGGLDAKKALLHCEGVSVEKPRLVATAAQWRAGVRHLQKDKYFRQMHKQVGDFTFRPRRNEEPLEVFINAIVSQQLSTKVASTILKRVNVLVHRKGVPCAKTILALPDTELRGAGLSGMKVSYLKDLARHSLDGKLPSLSEVRSMSDEQLVRCFTAVKGLGRWSVEMYLIFDLGRADIFPVDDYGIRKAVAQLHGLAELPSAKTMAQYGEAWKPYRSIASLYLWRSLDG